MVWKMLELCKFFRRNLIFYLFFLFLFMFSVTGLPNECSGFINKNDVPCVLLLPVNNSLISCASWNTTIYNRTTKLSTKTMAVYNSHNCYNNFSYTEYGTYSIYYSSGDTGSVVVKQDINYLYYIYVVSFVLLIVLLLVGYQLQNWVYIVLSGFLSCGIGIYMATVGFPNLNDQFLQYTMATIFLGFGFYLILMPFLENMRGLLDD